MSRCYNAATLSGGGCLKSAGNVAKERPLQSDIPDEQIENNTHYRGGMHMKETNFQQRVMNEWLEYGWTLLRADKA